MAIIALGITAIIGWLMLFLSYSYNSSEGYWIDKSSAAIVFTTISAAWIFGSGLLIAQAVFNSVN